MAGGVVVVGAAVGGVVVDVGVFVVDVDADHFVVYFPDIA